MAGEKNGKAYEAILKVALDSLIQEGFLRGNVGWNVKPTGIMVEPDFVIGNDLNHPDYIIMVTHSVAFHNSDMKCWRNIGELCEAKTMLTPMPIAINIIFDAKIKLSLKSLQHAAFDGQLIVGDYPFGQEISSWIKSFSDNMPADKWAKYQFICDAIQTNLALANNVNALKNHIKNTILLTQQKAQSLWELEEQRPRKNPPHARVTHFRHGITKRVLVGDALKNGQIKAKDGAWLSKLKISRCSIVKNQDYSICDPDLSWFINTNWDNRYKAIAKLYCNKGFLQQVEKVRNIALINSYFDYIIEHYEELITVEGMRKCLIHQHADPAYELVIPTGVSSPKTVWIYEYIGAIVKAATGKSQAFGYGSFIAHSKANSFLVGTIPVGEWCSSFINQFFSRKEGFRVSEEVISFVAEVLSSTLAQYSIPKITSLQNKIEEKHIKSEYGNKLLTHNGFAPLVSLLIDNSIIPSKASVVSIRNCFAEQADLTGRAGKIFVIHVKNTIIGWKTATDEGRDHKRKELSGKAVGLRYSWNIEKQKFVRRDKVNKLILLLDGTWTQKDLDALVFAGWDEIYYPDEVEKLKASIV